MAESPSCCLYWSFLIHFAAFASLLVGYSTPNWTLVKMSTGEVRLLGLVVTCDREKCDTLHVTSARMVFVVIFGMCTFCILLGLFSVQIFCLALCNRSCKEKNIGTCLSYFSLFIAFSIGGTLGLYQIDLREEAKPDVVSMWMGWSQYCIMGAAGGFFLGAWLNTADYCLRNRSRNRELMKRTAEIKAKVASHTAMQCQNKNVNVSMNTFKPDVGQKQSLANRRVQYANRDKWKIPIERSRQSQSPRMCNTVECVVRNAANIRRDAYQGKSTQKSTMVDNIVTGGSGNQNVDKRLVPMAKEHRIQSINVKEAPRIRVTTGSAGARHPGTISTSENTASEAKQCGKREEKTEFSDAALKYRLEKLQQLTTPSLTLDERRKLSAVREENKGNQQRENSITFKEKKVLSRQETKTLVGQSILQSSASLSLDICPNIDNGKQTKSERDNRQLKKQLSVESRTSKARDNAADSPLPKINEHDTPRHSKPPPLQRDGQISSLDTSFGSNTKLRQTRRTSGSSDSNSTRMPKDDVIPPIKRDSKTVSDAKKDNSTIPTVVPKIDSRLDENSKALTSVSKPLQESVEARMKTLPSQDSTNTADLTEEQLKRRQIVEGIQMAKKDRKKKRITQ